MRRDYCHHFTNSVTESEKINHFPSLGNEWLRLDWNQAIRTPKCWSGVSWVICISDKLPDNAKTGIYFHLSQMSSEWFPYFLRIESLLFTHTVFISHGIFVVFVLIIQHSWSKKAKNKKNRIKRNAPLQFDFLEMADWAKGDLETYSTNGV